MSLIFHKLMRQEATRQPGREFVLVKRLVKAVRLQSDQEIGELIGLTRQPMSTPRTHDALFRTLAETEVTSEGIEHFIRNVVSPWSPIELSGMDPEGRMHLFVPKTAEKRLPPGWRDQILDLRRCVHLWDL